VSRKPREISPTASIAPVTRTSPSCCSNGSPVAQLVPNKEKVCTGSDLAAILSTARLTDKESKAWRRDLKASRKTLKDAIVRRINPSVCAVGRTSAASGHERNQVAG
jgi:antitoxin (DNA-binding transcriptional repressor) of toxin-antitoxin stability system